MTLCLSWLEYYLNWFLCCFVSVWTSSSSSLSWHCTVHTQNHLWWPYVIGSITLHFSHFFLALSPSVFALLPFYCCHFIFVVDFFLINFLCHSVWVFRLFSIINVGILKRIIKNNVICSKLNILRHFGWKDCQFEAEN